MSYGNNQNSPVGFKPYRFLTGALWTGQQTEYNLASGYGTSLFEGDPVTFLNTGKIGIGTAGNPSLGVFQGVTYNDTTGQPIFQNFWAANTATLGAVDAMAKVVDDPTVEFDIQVSTVAGAPGPVNPVAIAQSNIGQNANFGNVVNTFNPTVAPNPVTYLANAGGGSTATGISSYFLDYNSVGNGATLNLKIMAFTPVPGNVASAGGTASGTLNFNNVLVLFNNHILKGGTGTAGI